MLGKRSPRRGLFDADNMYLDLVRRETFFLRYLAVNARGHFDRITG